MLVLAPFPNPLGLILPLSVGLPRKPFAHHCSFLDFLCVGVGHLLVRVLSSCLRWSSPLPWLILKLHWAFPLGLPSSHLVPGTPSLMFGSWLSISQLSTTIVLPKQCSCLAHLPHKSRQLMYNSQVVPITEVSSMCISFYDCHP